MVGIRDVATFAKVSVGTVSNVLNRPERVSPATVVKVQDAIEQLGFVRNDAARQLKAGASRTIGLVVHDIGNPFFADVARGAEARASAEGLTVLIGSADHDDKREAAYIDLFLEQRARGLLLTPVHTPLGKIDTLRRRGIPVVLVDRDGSDAGVPSVAVDDVVGGKLAADHVLSLGRRRLTYVGGDRTIRQVNDRLIGVGGAVASTPGAHLDIVHTAGLGVVDGWMAGEQLLTRSSHRPEALIAANDLVAIGLEQALVANSSLRIPDDIAIVGYDDIRFASSVAIPLTSIRQPRELIGSTAVDLLVGDRPETSVVFLPELVERQSTVGAARG